MNNGRPPDLAIRINSSSVLTKQGGPSFSPRPPGIEGQQSGGLSARGKKRPGETARYAHQVLSARSAHPAADPPEHDKVTVPAGPRGFPSLMSSDSFQIPDCSLIHYVPGIERRLGLDEYDMHLIRQRLGAVFDTAGHDDELPRPEIAVPIAQLHPEPALDHAEEFVFPFMVVPDELSPELHDLDVRVIQVAHNFRRPVLSNAAQLILKIDYFHCSLPHVPDSSYKLPQCLAPWKCRKRLN